MWQHSTQCSYWPFDGPFLSEGSGSGLLVLEGSHDIGVKFLSPWSFVNWRNSKILGLGSLWNNEFVLEGFLGGLEGRSVVNDIVINTEVWNKVVSFWSTIIGGISWGPGNSEIGLSLLGESEGGFDILVLSPVRNEVVNLVWSLALVFEVAQRASSINLRGGAIWILLKLNEFVLLVSGLGHSHESKGFIHR